MHTRPQPWSPWLLSTACALVLFVAAVDLHAQSRFEGEGRVVAVDEAKQAVTLDHAPIPGLLPAMRTEFPVQDVELLRRAQVGDVVRFSLVATQESHGMLTLSRFEIQPRSGPGDLRAHTTPAEVPLWLMLTLWVTLLTMVGSAGYILWRALGEIQRSLLAAANAQRALRDDLRMLAHGLEEIAGAVRDGYLRDLRRRIEAVQAVRGGNGRAGEGSRPHLLIVRQGRTDMFRTLQEHVEEPGSVHVVWDRRIRERRATRQAVAAEHRRGDRRGLPPSTWATLGFVLSCGAAVSGPGRSPGRR